MRKNWLAGIAASTVRRSARRVGALGARRFRAPLVPDAAFQDDGEPYPGHWRRFPRAWLPVPRATLLAGLDALPPLWRAVLRRRDVDGQDDAQVLARARAALRDRLDAAQDGPG
jgi:hypothetical protein